MYEVDYTGWVRTPEDISVLKNNKWKRFKFHLIHLYYAIVKCRWNNIIYKIKCVLTNTKNI